MQALARAPYPFPDLWGPIHKIVDAFGPDRVMWGSDITTCRDMNTYAEAVHYILYTDELSEADKEKILGGTLRAWLKWPRREVAKEHD